MSRADEYKAPKHSSSTVYGSNSGRDCSSGVAHGLSSCEGMNTDNNTELHINNQTSVSGNPRACIGKRTASKAKKFGHSFDVGS